MNILFICSSNICRSPYCEYILRRMIEADDKLAGTVSVSSSAALNQMSHIHPKTKEALLRRGFDEDYIDSHKPTVVYRNRKAFDEADIIIGMTKGNALFLPKKWKKKFVTLSEAATGTYSAIPDPWLKRDMEEYIDDMDVIYGYLEQYFEKLKEQLN